MAGEAKAGLVFSHRYTQHNTNPYRMRSGERLPFVEQVDHMSNPRLIDRTMHLVDLSGLSDHVTHIEPYLASEEAILSCHTPELLNRVKEADAAGDGDAGREGPPQRTHATHHSGEQHLSRHGPYHIVHADKLI